ncbi:MAG: hypothetical protein C4315_08510 [Chloroflexota bacterium]
MAGDAGHSVTGVAGPDALVPTHHRWAATGVGLLLLFTSAGIGFYGFSAFVKPLAAEFGWGRGEISLAITVQFLTTAAVGPLVGRMVDRYGPRRLMLVGLVLYALILLGLSRMTSQAHLLAGFVGLGIGSSLFGTVPVQSALAAAFGARRGQAVGLVTVGISLGGVLMTPVAVLLVDALGWRAALTALGLAVLAVMPPLVAAAVRVPAPSNPLQGPGDGAVSLGAVVRRPVFWLLGLAIFTGGLGALATLFHLVSFFTDRGLDPLTASVLLSLTTAFGIVAKLIFGPLCDLISARRVMVLSFSLQIAGLLGYLLLPPSVAAYTATAVVFGLGMGANSAIHPILTSQTFGLAAFGTAFGALVAFFQLASALGPAFAGLVYDLTGSYSAALLTFLAGLMVGLASLGLTDRLIAAGRA